MGEVGRRGDGGCFFAAQHPIARKGRKDGAGVVIKYTSFAAFNSERWREGKAGERKGVYTSVAALQRSIACAGDCSLEPSSDV
jgi:hypothetical protein